MPLAITAASKAATLTIRRGESSASFSIADVLDSGEDTAWKRVGDTWLCISAVLTQVRSRLREEAAAGATNEAKSHTWVTKARVEVAPALQVINLVPGFPLQMTIRNDVTSPLAIDADGGRVEVPLHGTDLADDVAVRFRLEMHGVSYETAKYCVIHAPLGQKAERSVVLSAKDKRNLPLRLELLHDTLPLEER